MLHTDKMRKGARGTLTCAPLAILNSFFSPSSVQCFLFLTSFPSLSLFGSLPFLPLIAHLKQRPNVRGRLYS